MWKLGLREDKSLGHSHKVSIVYGKSNCWCCLVAQLCPTLCNPMDCSPPGLSVQEFWTGWAFATQGGLPDPGIEPTSPALQMDFFTA